MTYYDDVLQDLVGHRSHDRNDEVETLKRQVAVLQRTVAALASILDGEDLGGGSSAFRARISEAMTRVQIDDDTYGDEEERRAPAMLGSAYRGAMPSASGRGCSICGKALHADDPELSLAGGGDVCLGCFQRAR